MTVTHVVGIDPGLVHTGVVRLVFRPDDKRVLVEHEAIAGPDAQAVKRWVDGPNIQNGEVRFTTTSPRIFIEKYQPRSHFNTDARMAEAQANLKQALPKATVVLNTGVKKVVKKSLMELLGVWSFPTATHHQDLRSAARIGLLGMLKSEPLNRLLSDVVRDHLAGDDWQICN